MRDSQNRGFVGAATAGWQMIARGVIDGIVAQEQFINNVRAITGWSEAAAKRLDRRLGILARGSTEASHAHYRQEWRRRYCEGWKYAKWPQAMRRFVK